MAEHTKLPWTSAGTYIVAKHGPTIADCSKSPSMSWPERHANAALIIKAVNSHPDLVKALEDILEANKDFRDGLPHQDWEGDPLQDACDAAQAALSLVGQAPERTP